MAINNILESTLNSYPVFKPNQVLTDGQLNDIVAYLDGQNRLTRVLLIGTGNVCGFEPVWANDALQISAGFGVTSDGYLIHDPTVPPLQLDRYRLRDVPVEWFGFGDNSGLPNVFTNIVELYSSTTDTVEDTDGTLALTKDILNDKVLIFVLELDNKENEGLCNNDCDERGSKRQFTLHKLLFLKEDLINAGNDALAILAKTYNVNRDDDLQDKFYHKYFMTHLAMPRFGYEPDASGQNFSVRLHNIRTYDTFKSKYAAILKKYAGELSAALSGAHRIFSPVLTPGEVTTTVVSIPTSLLDKINNDTYDILEIQYLYDHLADLTDAYTEFIEAAFDLIADCNFHPKHFPNHLLIRQFDGNGDPVTTPYSIFRTPYTQPPVYNENRNRLEEVRTLFNRLMLLAGSYTTPSVVGADEIRITPGKSYRAPLSERAVPYYYPAYLANVWNQRRNRFNRTGQVYSYHRPAQPPYNDPLIYEMEGSDFFRIEGHIGRDFWTVMANLDDSKIKYNLPFNVIALNVSDGFNDEIFQFECENFECEKEELRKRYLAVVQTFNETVIAQLSDANKLKLINDGFWETVKPQLDDFDYTAFNDKYEINQIRTFIIGPNFDVKFFEEFTTGFLPPEAKIPFQQVSDCFKQLENKILDTKNRHLFWYFAQTYPGLDHKGGVPVGGTFILAYVEPEVIPDKINQIANIQGNENIAQVIRQSRLVVADFYLPYSCCSDCPPICYVVARPKPVFVVTPNVFCEGDQTEQELTVVAHPGGGAISGNGYHFHDGKHWFRPWEAGTPDANHQVKLYYSVDGAMAEALITLVPPENPSFVVKLGNQVITDLVICEGEGPLTLEPVTAGGAFFVDGIQLNGNIYDSQLVEVVPGQPVQVIIKHRIEGEYCGSEEIKTLRIDPKPDPTFSFEGNPTQVCQDAQRVKMNPATQGGVFTAYISNTPAPGATMQELGKWYFIPSAVALNPGQSVVVKVKHTVTTPAGCTDSSERTITVIAKANPNFTIGNDLKQICQTANPVQLAPVAPGGTFKAFVQGNQVPGAIIGNSQFNPKAIALPGNNPVTVSIQYEVSVNGACPASHSQPIVVTPPPVAGFNAALVVSNNPDAKTVQVRVSGITPQNASKYTWTSQPEQSEPDNFPNNSNNFVIEYFLKEGLLPIQLDLVVESGGCASAKVSKTLLPLIQAFELFGVNPNGGEFPLLIIEDGATYVPGQFDSLLFNIRAIPFPFEVDHVVIELNDSLGNTIQHSSSTSKNYRLVEGTDPRIPVKEANYTVKATPFTKNGTAGTPRVVHFSIASDEVPRQPAPPAEPSEEAIAFLRKRDNAYRKEIDNLKSDEALAKTAGFQLAEGFAKFQGQAAELNERYEKTAKALLAEAGSVKKGSTRHEQVLQLLTSITHYFMDKQVFLAPQKLSTETLKTLEKQLPGIKKAGLTITEIKTAWQGEALKKQLQAKSVDQFIKVLK